MNPCVFNIRHGSEKSLEDSSGRVFKNIFLKNRIFEINNINSSLWESNI